MTIISGDRGRRDQLGINAPHLQVPDGDQIGPKRRIARKSWSVGHSCCSRIRSSDKQGKLLRRSLREVGWIEGVPRFGAWAEKESESFFRWSGSLLLICLVRTMGVAMTIASVYKSL
jgi:hypothetical protein